MELTPASQSTAPTPASSEMDRVLVRGIAWTGAAKYLTQVIRWASTIIVVRHLTPDDYGIFGMANIFFGLVMLLNEFGVGTAVVTLRGLDDRAVAQLNGIAVLFGAAACLMTCAMAYPLAWFYRTPALAMVVFAMSLGFVVRAFRTVPMGLLEKELRFKLFAVLEAIEAVVLAIAMVVFALAGFGYWTLVLGHLLGGFLGTVLMLCCRRHPIAWPRLARIGTALAFSWHVVVSRLTWFWYSNADGVIAGRALGQAALGAYTFGNSLASLPVEKITVLVGRVTPAFFSAVQDDNAAIRRYLLNLTEGLAIFTIPACWGLALVADTLVPVVLGENWVEAIVPLRLLAAYAAWRSIEALFHQVLVVKGGARLGARVGLACGLVLPIAFYVGQHYWGTAGLAAAWIVVHPLLYVPLYRHVLRQIELPPLRYLASLWPSVIAAMAMIAVVLLVRWFLPGTHLGRRLVIEIGAGAATYWLMIFLCFRERVARFRHSLRALRKG